MTQPPYRRDQDPEQPHGYQPTMPYQPLFGQSGEPPQADPLNYPPYQPDSYPPNPFQAGPNQGSGFTPPRRNRTVRWAVLALVALAVLAGVAALIATRSSGSGNTSAPGSTVKTSAVAGDTGSTGDATATGSANGSHSVTLEASGSGELTVTYVGADGVPKNDHVSSPWTTSFTRSGDGMELFQALTVIGDLGNKISCKITIDGKVAAQQSNSTGFASCVPRLHF